MTKKDFSIRHTAASINATVLGILIALVAAYAIYVNDSLRNAEFEAITEAERINQVFFARSAYYPKNLDGFAAIVNSAIDLQRKEMSMSACIYYMTFEPSIIKVKNLDEIKSIITNNKDQMKFQSVILTHVSGRVNGILTETDIAFEKWEKGTKPRLIS